MFLKSNLLRIKKRLDHAEHGGALLLGVNGICVIGHGSSKSLSVVSANFGVACKSTNTPLT